MATLTTPYLARYARSVQPEPVPEFAVGLDGLLREPGHALPAIEEAHRPASGTAAPVIRAGDDPIDPDLLTARSSRAPGCDRLITRVSAAPDPDVIRFADRHRR